MPLMWRYPMRSILVLSLSGLVFAPLTLAFGQDAKAKPGVAVWDTIKAAPAASSPDKDWLRIPLDKTADAFKGDAVVGNGRIAAVLRKKDAVVEMYGDRAGVSSRMRLRLQSST